VDEPKLEEEEEEKADSRVESRMKENLEGEPKSVSPLDELLEG